MCKPLSDGGQRCAGHTRTAFENAVFGTEAWDRAAAEHAATPAGLGEIEQAAQAALDAGDVHRWAALSSALTRGRGLREANQVAAGMLSSVRDSRAALAAAQEAAQTYRDAAESLGYYDEDDPTGAARRARRDQAIAAFRTAQAQMTDPAYVTQRPASPQWDDEAAHSGHLWHRGEALATSEDATFDLNRELRSVRSDYEAGRFDATNLALRTGTGLAAADQDALEQMDAVFTATAQPLDSETVFYRHYQPVRDDSGFGLSYDPGEDFTVGEVKTDPAFLATTTSRTDQSGVFGSWRMLLTAPAGTPVMAGCRDEREAVFARGTRLRVLRVNRTSRQIEAVVEPD